MVQSEGTIVRLQINKSMLAPISHLPFRAIYSARDLHSLSDCGSHPRMRISAKALAALGVAAISGYWPLDLDVFL
jgi:hypothetical protein